MDKVDEIILDPIHKFTEGLFRKWPQFVLIFIGFIINTFNLPYQESKITLKYLYAAIPISIGLVWFIWSYYRYRFLTFTQGKCFGIIWNWHWKRDRQGESTWSVSPIIPQCPKDYTRLDGNVKEDKKQYWQCILCGNEYGGVMSDIEEQEKLKNLIIGHASREYGFKMGEAQETGKLKK